MVMADVKKYIGGVDVGLYLDDFKMSTFRHTIKKDTMLTTFVLKNPVKQHVVVQSETVEIRQLMDRTAPCLDVYKAKGYSSNQRVTAAMTVDGADHRITGV